MRAAALHYFCHTCITFPRCFISNFLYANTDPNRKIDAANVPNGNTLTISSGNTKGSNGKAKTAGIRMPTRRNKAIIRIMSNSVANIRESIAKYNSVPTVADIVNTSPCLKAIFSLYTGF